MSSVDNPIRVLIGKPGLDGHDVGAKLVGRALKDAGMEVSYTGLRQTPEAIVAKALEKKVDVVGLSILSGTHMRLCAQVLKQLRQQGTEEIMVIAGGNIPACDHEALRQLGVAGVFATGTPFEEIVEFLHREVTR